MTTEPPAQPPMAAVPRAKAPDLPVGTVVRYGPSTLVPDGDTVLTRIDKPGRCPWRIGGPNSKRFAATWRVQDLINDGASITRPAQSGVKRRRT